VQARQFQDQASARLLRKLKNGQIHPTETGIALIALSRLLLEVRDEVIDALIAIERGEVNLVRFGSTPLVDEKLFRSFCALHKELLPRCTVRPTHGDAAHLAQEAFAGIIDAAIMTLPFAHLDLHIEELRRDRLVVVFARTIRSLQKLRSGRRICRTILRSSTTRNAIPTLMPAFWNCSAMPGSRSRNIREHRIQRRCEPWSRWIRFRFDPRKDFAGGRSDNTPDSRRGLDNRYSRDLPQTTPSQDGSHPSKKTQAEHPEGSEQGQRIPDGPEHKQCRQTAFPIGSGEPCSIVLL
jgi:hypothetical protein